MIKVFAVANRIQFAELGRAGVRWHGSQLSRVLALTTTLAQLSIYCVWLWQSFRQGRSASNYTQEVEDRCTCSDSSAGQITKAMWDYAMSNPVLLGAFGL